MQELPDPTPDAEQGDDSGHDDIEAQIKQEVEQMRPRRSSAPFQSVRLEVPCRTFLSTHTPSPVPLPLDGNILLYSNQGR